MRLITTGAGKLYYLAKVVFEVEAKVVKGEAEMKSSKAQLKSHVERVSRLGSLLGLMVLVLSVGQGAIAAQKLAHVGKSGEGRFLQTKLTPDQKSNSVKWLFTNPKEAKFSEEDTLKGLQSQVKGLQAEPAQFALGVKWAVLEAIKSGDETLKTFQKAIVKAVIAKSLADKDFFTSKARQDAYKTLIEKISKLSEKDLNDEEFLTKLFSGEDMREVREALGIELVEDTAPGQQPTGQQPTGQQPSGQQPTGQQPGGNQGILSPLPGIPGADPQLPAGPQLPPVGKTGEVAATTDPNLLNAIKAACDQIAQTTRGIDDRLNALRDALANIAAQRKIEAPKQEQQDLAKLAELLKREDPPAPPPAATPAVPPAAPSSPRPQANNPSVLDKDFEPQEQKEPQPLGPVQLPAMANDGPEKINVSYRINESVGYRPLVEANAKLAELEGRKSQLARLQNLFAVPQNPFANSQMFKIQADATADVQKAQAIVDGLSRAKQAVAAEVRRYKDGIDRALSPETREAKEALESRLQDLDGQLKQETSKGGMVGDDPDARAQLIDGVTQLQGQIRATKQALNQLKSKIKSEGDRAMNKLEEIEAREAEIDAKMDDAKGKLTSIKAESEAIEQAVDQRKQQMIAEAQAAANPGIAPRTTNAFRIQNQGGPTAPGRAPAPSVLKDSKAVSKEAK